MLKNSDIFCKDKSLPEATKQFVVRFLSPASPTHKTERSSGYSAHPLLSFFLSHFGACDGREGWSHDDERPEASHLEWFLSSYCIESEEQECLLEEILSLEKQGYIFRWSNT